MKFVRLICICKLISFFHMGMSPGAGYVVCEIAKFGSN